MRTVENDGKGSKTRDGSSRGDQRQGVNVWRPRGCSGSYMGGLSRKKGYGCCEWEARSPPLCVVEYDTARLGQ